MKRIRQPISKKKKIFLGVVGILLLVVVYSYISYQQQSKNPDDTTMPNLVQLMHGFKEISTPADQNNDLANAFGVQKEELGIWGKIKSTWVFQDVSTTYWRLFKGMFLGCLFAIGIGLLMGCYEEVAAVLSPPLSLLSQVPATAMIAVFYVMVIKIMNWDGEWVYVTMIGFGILPILTQSIYLSALNDLHSEEIDKAYTLGASHLEVIWNVVFQQILPKIIDSVRLQIGPAMVYLIAAEMLLAQVGMGYQIRMQQRLLHMAVVYDYLLILGVTGLILNKLIVDFRAWMCPWYKK